MRLWGVVSGLALLPLKALLGLSTAGLVLAQVVGTDVIDSARKITFEVAMLVAIVVLWKALVDLTIKCDARIAEKDKQIYELGMKSTEATLMMIRSINDLKDVIKDLRETINAKHTGFSK